MPDRITTLETLADKLAGVSADGSLINQAYNGGIKWAVTVTLAWMRGELSTEAYTRLMETAKCAN